MAQRRWLVRPDHEVQTLEQAVAAVSQEALVKAVYDGVIMLDRAGGVLAVSVSRATTGVPGERITTGAMVEWKDRTDARAQPEQDGQPILRAVDKSVDESVEPVDNSSSDQPEPIVVYTDSQGNVVQPPDVDEQDVPLALREA